MNYPAMRWAVEDCHLEGAAKPILFVIAYRADRDTGECWAGQRRIAKEAGVTRTHVQRVMAHLIRDGVLEVVEAGSGTKPDTVRIAPAWVEGDVTASGVVDGTATATGMVEGTSSIAGEVIHSPSSSGHTTWPQGSEHDDLVATLLGASGHMRAPGTELVATSRDDSGHSHVPLSSENAEKVLKQGSLTSRKEHVLDNASSAANAAGVVEAYEPPEVDEATRAYLRAKFGPKAKNGQEGKESA